MIPLDAIVLAGTLLPEWIIHTEWFGVLATFVAINSLMYATLAMLKVLPKGYALSRFNGRNRRTSNRSIYPHLGDTDPIKESLHASAVADKLPALVGESHDAAP